MDDFSIKVIPLSHGNEGIINQGETPVVFFRELPGLEVVFWHYETGALVTDSADLRNILSVFARALINTQAQSPVEATAATQKAWRAGLAHGYVEALSNLVEASSAGAGSSQLNWMASMVWPDVVQEHLTLPPEYRNFVDS